MTYCNLRYGPTAYFTYHPTAQRCCGWMCNAQFDSGNEIK